MSYNKKKDKRSYAEKVASFWDAIQTQKLGDLRGGLVNTAIEAQTRSNEGLTSIMVAALNGKGKSLDTLLDWYSRRRELRRKGWIDLRDDNGRTALMMAAAGGKVEIVESLLEKEAKIHLKDHDGLTARDHAVKRKKNEVVEFIDYWLKDPEDDVVEDSDGNVINDGLTSTQRNKLKKKQLQALERRGAKDTKSKNAGNDGDEDDDDDDASDPGPTPKWSEVANVVESVKMLRPVHEITIKRDDPTDPVIDPALFYLRGINRLEMSLAPGLLTSIPGSELCRLKKLQTLILNDNALSSLPDEIGKLKNLKVLEVMKNELTALPDTLKSCTNLEVLDVSFNKLTDLGAIKGLKNIGTLKIGNNNLTALDLDFENLSRLHDLIASNNQIEELPSQVGQLAGLMNLTIESNKIKEIPVELSELKKVKVLKLDGNPIKDPRVRKHLANEAQGRKDLWKYLQKNAGGGKGKGKKGKGKGKGKGKQNVPEDEDVTSSSPPVPPAAAAEEEEDDTGFFSDDSFDIQMSEL